MRVGGRQYGRGRRKSRKREEHQRNRVVEKNKIHKTIQGYEEDRMKNGRKEIQTERNALFLLFLCHSSTLDIYDRSLV